MTVAEALAQSGFTPEQIAALDPKLVTTFSTILTTAESEKSSAAAAAARAEADRQAWEKAKADAELLQRSNAEFYETKIVPGLTSWQEEQVKLQTETANAKALAEFYRVQNESARTAGFVPTDAPTYKAPVVTPNPEVTPGTPKFTIDDVRDQLGETMGTVANIQWKYRQLYNGAEMPMSPTELIRQARDNKFRDPATYAAQIFKFADKEAEVRAAQQKAHDDAIAKTASEAAAAEWKTKLEAREAEFAAEKKRIAETGITSSNPDLRQPPGSSKFAELQRQTKAGERPDPTKMTANERRQATLTNIHKAIEERETAVA